MRSPSEPSRQYILAAVSLADHAYACVASIPRTYFSSLRVVRARGRRRCQPGNTSTFFILQTRATLFLKAVLHLLSINKEEVLAETRSVFTIDQSRYEFVSKKQSNLLDVCRNGYSFITKMSAEPENERDCWSVIV